MKLTLNLKPTRVERFSKKELENIITNGLWKAIHCGDSFEISALIKRGSTFSAESVRVYSLEKRRKKVRILEKPIKWTKKQLRVAGYDSSVEKWTYRVVEKDAHWIAHYYDIPIAMIKMLGLEVKQGTRTFTIKQIKKG